MHLPGDPRQTAVSDLPKVILCLLAPSFEHSTLVLRVKKQNHSAIAARFKRIQIDLLDFFFSSNAMKDNKKILSSSSQSTPFSAGTIVTPIPRLSFTHQ